MTMLVSIRSRLIRCPFHPAVAYLLIFLPEVVYPFRRSILPFWIICILERTGEFPDTLQLLLPDEFLSCRIANERASAPLAHQRVNFIRKFLGDYDMYSSARHELGPTYPQSQC